jgi:hypothetical protein
MNRGIVPRSAPLVRFFGHTRISVVSPERVGGTGALVRPMNRGAIPGHAVSPPKPERAEKPGFPDPKGSLAIGGIGNHTVQ